MTADELKLLYPGSSLSALTSLGQTEVKKRFDTLKAHIRARLDGSPDSELPKIKAQVSLVSEIENAVMERLLTPTPATLQQPN